MPDLKLIEAAAEADAKAARKAARGWIGAHPFTALAVAAGVGVVLVWLLAAVF